MAYNMSAIFFFGCYYFKKININFDLMKKRFKILIFNSKYILFSIFILLCFTWNPKAVHHEDIGSIPIYRLLAKIKCFQGGHYLSNKLLRKVFDNNDNFSIIEIKEKTLPHTYIKKNQLKSIA